MFTIALDAMGGDFYPDVNISGSILAVRTLPISIILVGNKAILEKKINAITNFPHDKISIKHASEVIEMTDSPTKAFRSKKDSSIHVGLQLVKKNIANAFVSAGNTGAVLTASTFILGRIKGVERPALAAAIPSEKKPYILIDIGSNVDCKPSHLVQFALMGNCFCKTLLNEKNPRIGLLNIGEEKEKGNALTQQTYNLLSQIKFNFIGNVEGKDLTKGKADVVVCDGFVGNNLLKFGEGISQLFRNFFKKQSKKSFLTLLGLLLLKPTFKVFKKEFDYDEYGGAHFLGINGISIIAHGSASDVAIKNAIKVAYQSLKDNVIQDIESSLKDYQNISKLEEEKTNVSTN